MNTYTDFEYLLINVANAAGHDKLLFEERIEWAKSNGKKLMSLADEADDKAAFIRGVLEIQRVLNGRETNLPVGLDATASGLQMLAVASGCIITAGNVGLVDPNKRCDVYTACVDGMNIYLPLERHIGLSPEGFTRADIKDPFMTHFYFSKATPKLTFGDKTPEHIAFLKATQDMAPGASELMNDIHGAMLANGGKSVHTEYMWTLPDYHTALTRVFVKDDLKFELEELKNASGNSSTYTHRVERNQPDDRNVALVADTTHSLDGFVVREMQGRMNYDPNRLLTVLGITKGCKVTDRTKMISIYEADKVLREMDKYTGNDNDLAILGEVIESVIYNPRAPLITVHDEFKTLAPYCNQMRQYYINILAQMAESNIMQDILRQLYKNPNLIYRKYGDGNALATAIRGSNYAIC